MMGRRILTFSVALLVCVSVFSQGESNTSIHNANIWEKDYSKAKLKAKKQDKPLLIFFTGSDWCGPCKKLVSDFFESDRFKKLASDKFVLYEADFPRNRDLISKKQRSDNNSLKIKYNVQAYPTIMLVNGNGDVLGRRKGYNLMRDPSYHFELIESLSK